MNNSTKLVEKNKNNRNKNNAKLYNLLCDFIADKFLREPKNQNGETISQNAYAKSVGLSSSTISKIKYPKEEYSLPIDTIYSICRYEKYPLSKLFGEFEDKYGVDIPE